MFSFLKRFYSAAVTVPTPIVEPIEPIEPIEPVKPAEPLIAPVLLHIPTHVVLKTSMWVVTPSGKLGIVAKLNHDGTAVIHWVDSMGITISGETVSIDILRLARYAEIPACRMQITPAEAAVLGYV